MGVLMSMNYIAAKDLTEMPLYNGRETTEVSPVVKATITNIKNRKKFTTGAEFMNLVTDSVNKKFPDMTRNAVKLTVMRTLAKFFE
jgi:hypothetical protein